MNEGNGFLRKFHLEKIFFLRIKKMEEAGANTFKGLIIWYEELFCKFGWMVLARHEDEEDRLNIYIQCAENLIKDAANNVPQNPDKQRDMLLMANDTNELARYIERLREVKVEITTDEDFPKDWLKDFNLDFPFFKIFDLYKKTFDHFAGAYLEFRKGDVKKMKTHMKKVIKVIATIRHNFQFAQDPDCKADLYKMERNLLVLLRYVEALVQPPV